MPFLSPAKLLVVLVIALVVLGPDKLPKLARQAGALWSDLRTMRARLESGVRDTFPDLPSTERMTRAVRSPLSFLDDLADGPAPAPPAAEAAAPGAPDDPFRSAVDFVRSVDTGRPREEPGGDVMTLVGQGGTVHRVRATVGGDLDHADLN